MLSIDEAIEEEKIMVRGAPYGNYSRGIKYHTQIVEWLEELKAIKNGGISDDVCEYKIKDKVIYASCNNKQIASAFCWFNECGDYKYCPYCGKKIEVVE